MIPRGAFRIGVRVRGNNAIASCSPRQQQDHHQQQQHQQTLSFSTPTAVKKIAAIVMGAPGWLRSPEVRSFGSSFAAQAILLVSVGSGHL